MNSFFKSIICSTFACFIFSFSFSQDKILTKKGDTLTVFVKNIEKQKVIYIINKDSPAVQNEIAFENLHKIVWRTGKEFIIDSEFDNRILKKQEENKVVTKSESKKLPQEIGFDGSFQRDQNKKTVAPLPEIKVDTLPPAPVLKRNFMLFYNEYKIDNKRVNRDEFSEVLRTYDPVNYILFEEGLELVKSSVTKRLISGALRLGSIPLARTTPSLFVWGNYGLLTFSFVQQIKTWKGRKRIKESLNNYNHKRKLNFLRPPNAIVLPITKK